MASYIGRHAELYDLFYAEKKYHEEAHFIKVEIEKILQRECSEILEFACGTGSHAFALERLGANVTATDYSPDMIKRAEEKKTQKKSEVRFVCRDMMLPPLHTGSHDAVICLFDSIGYLKHNDSIQAALKNAYSALKPGGVLLLEFWHAAAMIGGYSPVRVRHFPTENGTILRISETEINAVLQTAAVKYTIYELNKDKTFSTFQETQTNRFFQIQEMAALLSGSGFQPIEWKSGFSNEQVTENTWHVISLSRRA